MDKLENRMVVAAIERVKAQKNMSRKIYGIMAHGLVPEELIYAAGGFPLRLILTGDKNAGTRGIDYMTSATCSFARSTVGQFDLKNELYKEIDAIIAGNYCNGELCSTEMISHYFKIPNISIVFPSTKTDSALKFLVAELRHFKEDIEKFAEIKITENQLATAIELYNEERRLIQEVVKTQTEKGFRLSGGECLNLLYQHFLYGVESAIENLKAVLKELESKSPSKGKKKIIFAGSGVPIGDNIIQMIENNGFLVMKNFTWTGLDYYQSMVEGSTIEALAKYYLNAENSGRMILSDSYFTNLTKIFRESRADGIIFYTVKYCSIFPSVISTRLKQILSEQKIPYLEIEQEYGVTTDAQLQTRLQAFKEMVD
jgi:benzoyl-CoA reductase/2-hydroxyglutaryl-CoA dehydratase subunit BcrC/BadD/HgdB